MHIIYTYAYFNTNLFTSVCYRNILSTTAKAAAAVLFFLFSTTGFFRATLFLFRVTPALFRATIIERKVVRYKIIILYSS